MLNWSLAIERRTGDHGTELTSNAILSNSRGMAHHRTGEADAECLRREFNGRLGDELLNETLFRSMAQARVALGSSLKNADMGNARDHFLDR
jgi:putative transposase